MTINKILKQELEDIKPSKETLKEINNVAKDFTKYLEKKLKSKKIKADVFIGGSLAKNTLTKRKKYDVDVFVRFDEKYEDKEISKLLGKILDKKAKKIHGSRDYYQIIVHGIIFEIIPVIKVINPKYARNITDLSYFHVNYIKKKLNKNKRLSDEILLAKTFAHAQNCYGAESYIKGFSGYSLELLICYYKSFLNFIKSIIRMKDLEVIDSEKKYKNKQEALRELNESRLQSPIILIDPTFKQRNALAGLSRETLDKFKENSKKFLKNPDRKFFEQINIKQRLERKYKDNLIKVLIKTNKQPGDISGTKSKKFFDFFVYSLEKEFKIKVKEFEYKEEKNISYFYFIIDKKKDEVIRGPNVTDVHNLTRFKKKHKHAFIKNHIAHAKIKHELDFNKWFKKFLLKDKKVIKQMSIKKIELEN